MLMLKYDHVIKDEIKINTKLQENLKKTKQNIILVLYKIFDEISFV